MTRTTILGTLAAIVIAGFATSPADADSAKNAWPRSLELGSMKAGASEAKSPMGLTTQSPNAQRKTVTPRGQKVKSRTRQ